MGVTGVALLRAACFFLDLVVALSLSAGHFFPSVAGFGASTTTVAPASSSGFLSVSAAAGAGGIAAAHQRTENSRFHA